MIKLFCFGLDEQQHQLLTRVRTYIEKDILEKFKPIEIIDLKSFDPEIDKNDIVLLFGQRAESITEGKESKLRLKLPEVYKLDASFDENKEHREIAFQKINRLIQILSSDKDFEPVQKTGKTLDLTEELPKELTTGVTKTLEQQQKEQGITHWSGNTIDGRSVKVTIEPEKDTADINITFAELHAVIGLKEAFRVKELEFVYKPTDPTRKDSTE